MRYPANAEYTEGPWRVCHTTFGRLVVGFHVVAKPHGSSAPICEAREVGFSETEMVANGALISAAPDLAEALHLLLSDFREIVKDYRTQPVYHIALEALYKAGLEL